MHNSENWNKFQRQFTNKGNVVFYIPQTLGAIGTKNGHVNIEAVK